jgi:hypothetical protein
MQSMRGILSLLLALALVVSGAAMAGHVTAHKAVGSELCSLCVHAAGSDGAIAPKSAELPAIPPASTPDQPDITAPVLPVALHDHPSRAPPFLNRV